MAEQRYARGDTARLLFDLISSGVPSTNAAPTAAVRRVADGLWFRASDKTWQPAIVNNPMTELDSANEPGQYYLDFDQSSDTVKNSLKYRAKFVCAAPVALEYRELVFGPLPGAVPPLLCSVQGTLFDLAGNPLVGALVMATLIPTFTDGLGRGIEEGVIKAFSDAGGNFNLAIVQGAVVRLEIEAIGYDRRATIPASSSVVFTSL